MKYFIILALLLSCTQKECEETIITQKDSITAVSGILIQEESGQIVIKGDHRKATFINKMGEMTIVIKNDTLIKIFKQDTIRFPPR